MDFYTCSIICFIVVEGSVLFEVDNFSVIDGILSLIASLVASYYILHISYLARSLRAASFLLFVQETVVGILELNARPPSITRLLT